MVRIAILALVAFGCVLSPLIVQGAFPPSHASTDTNPSIGVWAQMVAGKTRQGTKPRHTAPLESPTKDGANWSSLKPKPPPTLQQFVAEPLQDRSEKESWEPSDDEDLSKDGKGYQTAHDVSYHEPAVGAKNVHHTKSPKAFTGSVESTASADLGGQHMGGYQPYRTSGASSNDYSDSDSVDDTTLPHQLVRELKNRDFQRRLITLRASVDHLNTFILSIDTNASRKFLATKQAITNMVRTNRWHDLHYHVTRHVRAAINTYQTELLPVASHVYQLLREVNPEYFAISVDGLLPSHYPWAAYHGLFGQEKDLHKVSATLTTYVRVYQHTTATFGEKFGILYEYADHFRQMTMNKAIRNQLGSSVSALLTEANRMGRQFAQHAPILSDVLELWDLVATVQQYSNA
ncbi:hypothetical protein H4R35_005324 [Dimargaris xerosporica]|nr:hypothetical protein H4R35_005324 [Dimargaris xerosporica]